MTLAEATSVDWVVFAVGFVSILIGLVRGFVRTVFAVGAWLVGLVATPLAAQPLMPLTGEVVPVWFVYLLCFVALFILTRMLGGMLLRSLRKAGLGGADRLLGGVLGAVRALAIVAVLAIVAQVSGYARNPVWQQALTRPLLDRLVLWAQPWLPERVTGIRRA